MKNSPFQRSHTDNYNVGNTTQELLKFQLQEQSRTGSALEQPLLSLQLGNEQSNFLQSVLFDKSFKDDIDGPSDESFDESDVSGISTPSSDVSSSWKAAAEKDPRTYLNLKVLIENSVFDTSKMSHKAVIPLHKVKKLKQKIAEKQEQKDYLTERISVSSQFCSTLLTKPDTSETDLDPKLLLKILKQNVNFQMELIAVSQDLESLTQKLSSHNMACLVLGYVEDLKMSSLSNESAGADSFGSPENYTQGSSGQALETLFSHVASLAVQRSVSLPECPEGPEQESLNGRIAWTIQCIDALIQQPNNGEGSDHFDTSIDNSVVKDHSFLSSSPYNAYKRDLCSQDSKTLSEYKLALNDLRFSHQYFMKEYEYLKENSLKTILDYRRKNGVLEKEVNRLKNGSSMSISSSSSRDILESKDKEIAQLRREVNAYKIDFLGNKSPRNSVNEALLTPELNEFESSSPSFRSPGSSMSNAILRKEFKKIVADMQDQYEIELSEERFRRRGLEEKLQSLDLE